MGGTINSISEAIARFYQTFVLRDLLGFVLPGIIIFISLWFIADCPKLQKNEGEIVYSCKNSSVYLAKAIEIYKDSQEPKFVLTIIFIVMLYVLGWSLQCVHYGLINLLFSDVKQNCIPSWFLMTRIALAPDKMLEKVKGSEIPSRLRDSSLYTERISTLALMTGNVALSGFLFFATLFWKQKIDEWIFIVGLIVMALMYLEHWRLWNARNLRHKIYVDAASKYT